MNLKITQLLTFMFVSCCCFAAAPTRQGSLKGLPYSLLALDVHSYVLLAAQPSSVSRTYEQSLHKILQKHTSEHSSPLQVSLRFASQMGNLAAVQDILNNNSTLSVSDLRRARLFSVGEYGYWIDAADVKIGDAGLVAAMINRRLLDQQKRVGCHRSTDNGLQKRDKL